MSEVDDVIFRSQETLERTRLTRRAPGSAARKRREREVMRRVGRIAAADAAIIVAALVIGFFVPLGMFGALGVMLALMGATVAFAVLPVTPEPSPERFHDVPLKALPLQTEAWLDRQRPALPAPAVTLVDSIGVKLEALGLQLATLDEREPAAAEIRKLVGEQIPELVKGYQRVPQPLRGQLRHGQSPDQQLVEGLRVIDAEIADMSAQLAQGDLDSLATRQRYLQIKYRDEEIGG
jgi:hypothetical protein